MSDKKNQNQTGSGAAGGDTSIIDDNKLTLLTKEGLEKLKEELKYLKEVKRKEVAERIKEAISYGDLSENSEYEEAKNEQAFLEGRILELEEKVKFAKIISDHSKTSARVQLGSTIVIVNTGKKNAEKEQYTIVGSTEADPLQQRISNESPIGHALLDRKVGDEVKVMVPAGVCHYKLMKIT
ncbi:MAG: Transcription elongation factor GreA [Candidatus Peregrinibacteria bacterium GW2011_GWA2_47_7]|nr:MAG: Transcription elongation factor GreA [Candidatus Peregrinibacteria bacterium GW2011_GWA2_47_7]